MLVKFLKLVVKTFFKDITIKGIDNLPDSGPVIFTPNHPNALIDPLLMFFLPTGYKIRFVAKAPLFKIPLFGWIMRKMHAIPVVRRFEANGKVDYKSFFDACIDSLAVGDSITIFPEGVSLPQPYMADIRTGAARLFFMARNRNIDVKIVPVGLNYEHGSIFRTSAVIWAAPTLGTTDLVAMYQESPQNAVRNLTKKIKDSLDEHVFQTESYQDRELMLLLEQIYGYEKDNVTWSVRLERLKQFEMGLILLKDTCGDEIGSLQRMLSRYETLTKSLESLHRSTAGNLPGSPIRFLLVLLGLPFAGLGWLLNVLPYQLINLVVKHMKKYEESAAATYKVLYALLFFPLTYVLETGLVYLWLGWVASVIFAILVIPLSYFTLFFHEWVHKGGWGIPIASMRLKRTLSHRILTQIKAQRARIISLVDSLAARIDKQPE
jgi:glycerol-3-phosphate O-acyltransferase / dihydroxyacetone phosphate acyltransferase